MIFRYWHDHREMPEYIRACLEYTKEPQIVYDQKSFFEEFINPESREKVSSLCHAHQADIFRISVLEKYGGVYLDADALAGDHLSLMCNSILNDDEYSYVGVREYDDKWQHMISNAFIACKKGESTFSQIGMDQLATVFNDEEIAWTELGSRAIYRNIESLQCRILDWRETSPCPWYDSRSYWFDTCGDTEFFIKYFLMFFNEKMKEISSWTKDDITRSKTRIGSCIRYAIANKKQEIRKP